MSARILITTSSFQLEGCQPLEALMAEGYEIILNPFGRRLTEQDIAGLMDEHKPVGMIAGVEPLTRSVLQKSANLKVISRCGVGLDSLDLVAADEQGITVTITPGGPTSSVSELTLGLMLAACRRVVEADLNIRNDRWGSLMGRLLAAQTIGLIGAGRIGLAVARLCKAFGCEVIAYDPHATITDGVVEMVCLEVLLERSDVISLHVPLIDETRQILNRERIFSMKQGAILINAARGGLVDETALKEALDSGHLAAAALDCFEQEPYQGELLECPTAILTCHMGSYAKEARAMMEHEAAENLAAKLQALNI